MTGAALLHNEALMNCLICAASMRFYFSKRFALPELESADYWCCEGCGFVLSRTHFEMSATEWQRLNHAAHAIYQGSESDPGDPRWRSRLEAQARVLDDAAAIGLIQSSGHWLDYACGDGKLTDLLQARHGRALGKYDRYMAGDDTYLQQGELAAGGFDLVVTTSVFEHLTRRGQFDAIHALVAPQGVLATHTLVCETVPEDPGWFYLVPAHCAFHTNRSMQRLFDQWGYTCSVYSIEAQLWLWFKDDADAIEGIANQANQANQSADRPRYEFKRGFMDYWKASPLRRQV